jgi:N-acetyl-anhydromuramyl-L-alanine amidase AmpD
MPIQQLTPFLKHRARNRPATLIVLHATAGRTAEGSIKTLRGKGFGYHYIIARDGKDAKSFATSNGSDPLVWAAVPEDAQTSHVGSTIRPPETKASINACSIGLSLANLQDKSEPYTPLQLEVLDALLADIRTRISSLRWLTTHAVVQPWNRSDPQRIDGHALAARHDLEWWQPTADEVKKGKAAFLAQKAAQAT